MPQHSFYLRSGDIVEVEAVSETGGLVMTLRRPDHGWFLTVPSVTVDSNEVASATFTVPIAGLWTADISGTVAGSTPYELTVICDGTTAIQQISGQADVTLSSQSRLSKLQQVAGQSDLTLTAESNNQMILPIQGQSDLILSAEANLSDTAHTVIVGGFCLLFMRAWAEMSRPQTIAGTAQLTMTASAEVLMSVAIQGQSDITLSADTRWDCFAWSEELVLDEESS